MQTLRNDLQTWSSDPSLVYTLAGFNAVAAGQLVSSLITRMVNARAFPGAEVAQGFELTDGNEPEYKAVQELQARGVVEGEEASVGQVGHHQSLMEIFN